MLGKKNLFFVSVELFFVTCHILRQILPAVKFAGRGLMIGFVLCSKKFALAQDLMKQCSLFTITRQGKFCTQHHTMSFSFLKLMIFQIL